MHTDPEHIRRYQVFEDLEEWVKNGDETFTQNGKTLRKTLLHDVPNPGLDTVAIVRQIFQGPKLSEVTVMEGMDTWKIEVVE